jgi:hypothetical protein
LKSASMGKVLPDRVMLNAAMIAGKTELTVNIE